jgi:hypothetical protein
VVEVAEVEEVEEAAEEEDAVVLIQVILAVTTLIGSGLL